jgi:hypothetical protein
MLRYAVLLVALAAGLTVLAVPPPTVHFVDLSTAPPPTFLGPLAVAPISEGPQAAVPIMADVTTVPLAPFAGTPLLTFSKPLSHRVVPDGGCATWSHGYTGSVYFLESGVEETVAPGLEVTLALPPHAQAFYFYAEPNSWSTFTFYAITDTGLVAGPIFITGASGANGFGFYADPGAAIASIIVQTDTSSGGFAIGEFGLNLNGFPTWLSFQDDRLRSSFCVNNLTGEYQWSSCPYPTGPAAASNGGCISMGTLRVLNSATLFRSYPQDPALIYLTYDPLNHRARGYRNYGTYNPLSDLNTTNNPPCGFRPPIDN